MASKYEQRATDGLRALKHRGKVTMAQIAERSGVPESSMSRIYNGRQPVTLKMLDAIEAITGESAVEMLIDPTVDLKAVTPPEAALLRFFRSWPKSTRDAFIAFASFFADEGPATHDQRRAHEQLRALPDGKRRTAYAYLTFLTEGFLPGEDWSPDIRIALGLPETAAPQSTHNTTPTQTTKRTKRTT